MARPAWSRVRPILEAALDREGDDRFQFVEEQCGVDEELRRTVLELLAHEPSARAPLLSPVQGLAAYFHSRVERGLTPGTRLGDYRIERIIASGGMGVVYEAWQDSPRRRVALKVLKSWLSSSSEVSRFRYEIEVLARLQHPGIAQVYASGAHEHETPEGHGQVPYFALEFVEGGQDLLAYVRSRDLGLRERLDLFVQVCDAVHHGHQKGVMHRDLKPGNVLVTPEGRVKVIDFGVARAVESEMDLRTRHTQSGQLIGTPFYMSPEQYGVDPSAVDTRSDVWALGVVLFELLSGELPFDLESRPMHEVSRIVCEEPARRLRSLSRSLPVELDWIVLKALEKIPARRYASAAEMAADVRRFLAHEPVLAGRPGLARRVFLALRRNRMATAIGSLATVAILASATWYLVSLGASRAAERARFYAATLSSAAAALRQGDMILAHRALRASPEELRAWEWNHLNALLDESVEVLGNVDSGPVARPMHDTVTWAVDGLLLGCDASGSGPVRCLGRLDGEICRIAWSPDGEFLVAAEWNGRLRLFDCTDELRLVSERLLNDIPHTVEFSPCGDRVAVALEDQHVLILDSRLQRVLHDLTGLRGVVQHARFASDEDHVLTASTDGRVTLWSLRDGASRELSAPGESVACVAITRDLRRIALATSGGALRVIDLDRGFAPVFRRELGSTPATDGMAFDSSGRWLAAGDHLNTLHVFDTHEGRADLRLRGHVRTVVEVAWSEDGMRIFTHGLDGVLRSWEPARGSAQRTLQIHVGDVGGVRFSPDSRRIVSAPTRYGALAVWDGAHPRLVRERFAGQHAVGWADFSPRGRWIATVGRAAVFDAETLEEVWRVPSEASAETPSAIAWDPRDETLVVASGTGNVRRWRVGAAAPECEHDHAGGPFTQASLHAPTDRLALAGVSGEIVLLRASDLTLLARAPAHAELVTGLAIAPDGASLYSTSLDARLRTWYLPSLAPGRELEVESVIGDNATDGVNGVVLSPDGTRLAIASRSSFVRVYDSRSLEEIITLPTGGHWVTAIDFAPDGHSLAAGTSDGRLALWSDRPIGEARPPDLVPSDEDWSREGLCRFALDRLSDERTREPELTQAMEVASALRWTDRIDPLTEVCAGLVALRRGLDDRACRRAEEAARAARGSDEAVWCIATALQAVALARLGDVEQAARALAAVQSRPTIDRHAALLIEEARSQSGAGGGASPALR